MKNEKQKSNTTKFRSIRNFKLSSFDKEKESKLKSLTVPNDAMTIQQLFEKAAQGMLDVKINKLIRESGHDDIDIEKMQFADPVDKQEAVDLLKDRNAILLKHAQAEGKKHADNRKALEEKMDAELADKIQKRLGPASSPEQKSKDK